MLLEKLINMLVKSNIKICILFLSVFFVSQLYAQQPIVYDETEESDTGLRLSAEISKRLNRFWSVSLEEEVRFSDDISRLDRLYSTLTVAYRINPYINTSIGYQHRLIQQKGKPSTNYVGYLDFRHRGIVSASFSYPVGQFEFNLRQRMNVTLRTDSVNPKENSNPEFISRTRIQAEYSFWSIPLKPYVSVEMFNPLNNPAYISDVWLETLRYTGGFSYRLDARSRIELYYFYEYEMGKDVNIGRNSGRVTITTEKEHNHVLGVAYQYRF
jgi:hypothetical protein